MSFLLNIQTEVANGHDFVYSFDRAGHSVHSDSSKVDVLICCILRRVCRIVKYGCGFNDFEMLTFQCKLLSFNLREIVISKFEQNVYSLDVNVDSDSIQS